MTAYRSSSVKLILSAVISYKHSHTKIWYQGGAWEVDILSNHLIGSYS